MSLTQRGGVLGPRGATAPVGVTATTKPWWLAVSRVISLLVGILALVAFAYGIGRSHLVIVLVSWCLLSGALAAMFALARARDPR